jgi:uncharacterized Zn finger protein (UPF0148 family)
MKVRGERVCQSCGAQWSYYETGTLNCPECGSMRSVGVGDRAEHTAGSASLDLSDAVAAVDEEPLRDVAERAVEAAATYLRAAGFVKAGELQQFDDTHLAAAELRRLGQTLRRAMRVTDREELYFVSLLRAAHENERLPPEEVPESLRAERGLAVAASADAYVSDVRRLDPVPEVGQVLSTVRAHRKRIEALDGDVAPAEAERIVRALRDIYRYLREDEEAALARAGERLGE